METTVQWKWGIDVVWSKDKLDKPGAEEMVLADLRLLIIGAHQKMTSFALSLGVFENVLHPNCPAPPPMPPVKPPKESCETYHFPAGMNYSTCAKAMNVQTVSLKEMYAACGGPTKKTLTRTVVITTRRGFKLLVYGLPTKPKVPRGERLFDIVPFFGVPVRKYADEGMARAAAIIADADGYDVMLFLPESGKPPIDDKT